VRPQQTADLTSYTDTLADRHNCRRILKIVQVKGQICEDEVPK